MLKKDLHPPRSGLAANPVLYGVAVGLAQLFPLERRPAQDDEQASAGDLREHADEDEAE